MTFLTPAFFYASFAAGLLILLSFLRARARRRGVSALELWVGLTETPESRSMKLHRFLDPLLFLQLAALAVLVLAMVQPMLRREQTVFRGLALVVDSSASMRTETESGDTRYDLAVERVRDILASASSSRMTLIQFDSQSAILVAPTDDESALMRALEASGPSWRAGGDAGSLIDLFSAVGGLEEYDRIVLLTDHPVADLPPGIDVELFQEGRNVGITAFTVRENLGAPGVSVFLELSNGTEEYLEPTVTIEDEFFRSTFSFLLAPGARDQFVVPIPMSRGTRFTAVLAGEDDFRYDNERVFALGRPDSLRVHWVGPGNRFLRAGLESVLPLQFVAADEPADLTILVGQTVSELPEGNLLLVRTSVPGQVRLGDPVSGGFADTVQGDHPLLRGIDPSDIYVESLPSTEFFIAATPLLMVGDHPLITDASTSERAMFVLSTDLTATNLPITVDFPILMRNLLAVIQRLPTPLIHEWHTVGRLIDLREYGDVVSLEGPSGEPISTSPGQVALPTTEPGYYLLKTRNGTTSIAVNVDPAESLTLQGESASGTTISGRSETKQILMRLWPYLALLALALLLTESIVYVRSELTGKGAR